MISTWGIIIAALLVLFLLLRFFVCKFFYKCILLNDILKEKNPDGTKSYSQGRIYLFLSIICYYGMLTVLSCKALKPSVGFDITTIQMIIDALQWAILLMAGYVFGGKGLEVIKILMESKKEKKEVNVSDKDAQA